MIYSEEKLKTSIFIRHQQHHNRVLTYKSQKPQPDIDAWSEDEEIATERIK